MAKTIKTDITLPEFIFGSEPITEHQEVARYREFIIHTATGSVAEVLAIDEYNDYYINIAPYEFGSNGNNYLLVFHKYVGEDSEIDNLAQQMINYFDECIKLILKNSKND